MKLLLSEKESERFKIKKNKGQEKVDKYKEKLDTYEAKQLAITEKRISETKLQFIKKMANLEKKQETKLEKLRNNEANSIVVEEITNYFSDKMNYLKESEEIALKNLDLVKSDLVEGLESAYNNSIRINVNTIDCKVSKINYKRNWKKIKTEIDAMNLNSKDKAKKVVEEKQKLFEESDKLYKPSQLRWIDYKTQLKNKWDLYWLNTSIKFHKCSQFSFKDWINLRIWTIPLWMYLCFVGILIATTATKIVEPNMIYGPAILLTVAIISGAIFSKIPIWKKYFGGAVMGSMFVGAFLVYFGFISNPKQLPQTDWNAGHYIYRSVEAWFKNQDFLSLYISVLLVGAVLLIPRKMIIKATGGFFVLIVAGTILGIALGYIGAQITGMSFKTLILYYALPILCDGNGGGIQPIGKIAGKFGYNEDTWITKALAISTLASIMSVIAAAIVNGVGKAKPALSGNGKLMLRDIHTVDRTAKSSDRNIAVTFLLILMLYMLSDLLEKAVFTEERIKILIPNFAWMIVICLILNIANIVPTEMKVSAEKINKFISKQTTWLLMVGVGIIYIHLDEFIKALNPTAIFISFLFVLGAAVGPMLIAKVFKFNAVESAVSAGLCMTAQGGSGAIAVLGASERMELMPFGQITCRIAGSVVLIFAAVAFSQWPPESGEIAINAIERVIL